MGPKRSEMQVYMQVMRVARTSRLPVMRVGGTRSKHPNAGFPWSVCYVRPPDHNTLRMLLAEMWDA